MPSNRAPSAKPKARPPRGGGGPAGGKPKPAILRPTIKVGPKVKMKPYKPSKKSKGYA